MPSRSITWPMYVIRGSKTCISTAMYVILHPGVAQIPPAVVANDHECPNYHKLHHPGKHM